MPEKKNVHVVPHEEGWAVQREGAERASSLHERQEEAIEAARRTAQREEVELLVHDRAGKVRSRDSYGNDPTSKPN